MTPRERTEVRGRIPGEGLVTGRGVHFEPAGGGPRVGVLGLQGDVLEHLRMLGAAGARASVVTSADDLDDLDGILLPGGESTTIGRLLGIYGLLEPLRARLREGLPAFGTCAGAVLLGQATLHHDGRPSDQPLLGALDATTRRNAFGRQVASFEAEIDVAGLDGPMRAVFIRAPWFEQVGPGVEVLARVGTPLGVRVVVARQAGVLASAFHPELTGDVRLHELFVSSLVARGTGRRAAPGALGAPEGAGSNLPGTAVGR